MVDRQRVKVGWCVLMLSVLSGCNSCEQEVSDRDMGPGDAMDASMMEEMGGGRPEEMGGGMPDMGGDLGSDMGDMSGMQCPEEGCPTGMQCVQDRCIETTCELLQCDEPEFRCEALASGGAECVSNACVTSEDCAEDRYCDATSSLCLEDTCVAATSTCGAGNALSVCALDGSGFEMPLQCPDTCVDGAAGQSYCSCEDDWDCPTFMRCEAGQCLGSGRQAECRLEPVPFSLAQPELEASWGTKLLPEWPNPYPTYANVAMPTIVANLDDDNLDGVINEFDFPEVIFVGGKITQPFDGSVPAYEGVLRVLHGGGPQKGATAMAICGDRIWREGDAVDDNVTECDTSQGEHFRVFGAMAVADLNGDGSPEMVTLVRASNGNGLARVRVLSNTGNLLVESDLIDTRSGSVGGLGVSVADVDADGMGEVLVGGHLIEFDYDVASQTWTHVEEFSPGNVPLSIACVGDFTQHEGLEWFERMALWKRPARPAGYTDRGDCTGAESGEDAAWCTNQLVAIWDRSDEVRTVDQPNRSWVGLCAVADVWGADAAPSSVSELDGTPEIVLIGEEELIILRAEDGEVLLRKDLRGLMPGASRSLSNGGAPNIDDFDGDGLPEIGAAFSERYVVVDLQPTTTSCEEWSAGDGRAAPSQPCATSQDCGQDQFCDESVEAAPVCRCLHNSWVKQTEDDSSRRTGSSVFDFNGDGAAEVVYNDECFFRIYDGRDGSALFEQPSEHITNVEYPVVADVDNDGNAEIVFSSTSQGTRCSIRGQINPATNMEYSESYNTGVQIWGDRNDAWVSARRIWNQHAYSVTNVYEDGRLPMTPINHWEETTQGLLYNTFRSNPRSEGIAPDLVVSDVRLSSPQMGCGELSTTLRITGRVENRGDLRVGAGVVLVARGEWADGRVKLLRDGAGDPLVFVNTQSIEPLRSVRFELLYDALIDGESEPPRRVILEVDPDPASLQGEGVNVALRSERECREDNNVTQVEVSQESLADLRVVSVLSDTSICPSLSTSAEVVNDGSAAVSGVSVAFYAGSPDLGGKLLGVVEHTEQLAPGESVTIPADLDLSAVGLVGFLVRVYAVATPLGGEDECNLSNNVLDESAEVFCPQG